MMGYGYSMMGGWSGMMIIPAVLIVIAMYVVYNQVNNNKLKYIVVKDNALDILNKRFARGEISEEEYYSMKNILKYK